MTRLILSKEIGCFLTQRWKPAKNYRKKRKSIHEIDEKKIDAKKKKLLYDVNCSIFFSCRIEQKATK